MSEAVLPPKKSKAAREATQENGHESDGSVAEVNVFKITVVEGKRERKAPVDVQKITEWINSNLEEKEGVAYHLTELYDAYLETCEGFAVPGVELYTFNKYLKDQFPKGFGIKETSSHHGLIKERKKRPKSDKPKAPSLQLKLKDIVARIIKELGNPLKGLRFVTIKMHIAAKYPALRIDQRAGILKNHLMQAVWRGTVELVKGVGAAGFYRLPGPELNPDGTEKKEEPKPKEEKKGDKEKDKEDTQDEVKAENDKEEAAEENKENDKKVKKTQKKKKKRAAPKSRAIIHSEPARIEDTFPLAMTYMSEPKSASAKAIKKYIADNYRKDLPSEKLKKVLYDGEEKGFWECIRGDGLSGTYQLTIVDFDPTDDKDILGMTVNAITACNEPKQCSAGALKSYIIDYHPEFKIVEKPHLFKKAVERACQRQDIVQVSGIGCMGSFQLHKPFAPNPSILAGLDTTSDYDDHPSDDDDDTDEEGTSYAQGFSIKQFQDAYTPRPTKKRGRQRAAASKKIETLQYIDEPAKKKKSRPSSSKRQSMAKKKSKYRDSSSSSSSSEEEESSSESSSESEEEANSEEEQRRPAEKYVPRGTKSRGGGTSRIKTKAEAKAKPTPKGRGRKVSAARVSKKEDVSPKRKSAPKSKGRKKAAESSSEEEEEKASPKRKSTPKGKGRKVAAESSSDEEEEVSSRRRSAPQGKGNKKAAESSSEEEEFFSAKEKSATKGRGRPRTNNTVKSTPKGRKKRDSSSEEEKPTPARRKSKPKGKGRKNTAGSSSEEEAELSPRAKSNPRAKAGKRAYSSSDEEEESLPKAKSAAKARGHKKVTESDSEEDDVPLNAKTHSKGRGHKKAAASSDEEIERISSSEEDAPPTKKSRGEARKAAPTPKRKGKGKGRATEKPARESDTSEEEPEVIEDSAPEESEEENLPSPRKRGAVKSSPKKATAKGRGKGKGRK